MIPSRIRTSHQDGEVAPNTWQDFDWVHDHEVELLSTIWGMCVARL